MRRFYVYYRVPAQQLAEAVAAVRALHAGLRCPVELLRRPELSKGCVTLMDVYQLDDAAAHDFEARAAGVLAPWLDGPRHVEVFEPVR